MFVALLRKELRQLRLWGLAAGAVLLLYALGQTDAMQRLLQGSGMVNYNPLYSAQSPFLQNDGFGEAYSVLMMLCGIMLGFAQIAGEQMRKTWQFLLHRPVSRGLILTAKLLAGTLWYAVAVGVPLALLSGYAIVPGHYAAPWRFSMLYPFAVMAMAGWLGYLSGVQMALRRARWYGTRFAALPAAVLLAMLAWIQDTLLAACILLMMGALLLIWAAIVAIYRREI